MNAALLLQLALSLLRHFLPWATALLAGMGVQVTDGTPPYVTLVLAIVLYVGAQGWSFARKWWAARKS